MKYCVVYGSPRKKNTYHAVQIVKERLTALGPAEFTEFYLPQDLPKFCTGCFTCIMKDEALCPHREYTESIERAMLEADGLIFSSPVYVMEVAAPMKNMLDHFGYLFMPHRPHKEMFRKSALVVSTTAGAGTKYAMDAIARSLSYWGVSHIFRCGFAMQAADFNGMKKENRSKAEQSLRQAADRLYESLKKGSPPTIRTRGMFFVMKKMVLNIANNPPDRAYWKEQGWDRGEKPWNQAKGKQE
ncbi:flavodoxin family protein [Faecalispora anaeroviscerum]|uniref:flavodoxin family protein n=1 Tax=Faecalispora anaeroviscerum TaxID=2991836 RepID=UPI0024BAD707|nr:flavodoxin family protein [Faecalispora anaeroviscerum]